MPKAACDVAAHLLPDLQVLDTLHPEAARRKLKKMRGDTAVFVRGALGVAAAWMVREIGVRDAWVWAVGDPHLGNFAVLATGPRDAGGRSAPRYAISDIDDEHPAPWRWDLLRCLSSLAAIHERIKAKDFDRLAEACLESWSTALDSLAQGREPALPALPPGLAQLLAAAAGEAGAKRHLAAVAKGQGAAARLLRNRDLADDPQAAAFFAAAIAEAAWPAHRLLDVARRTVPAGISSLGRRRWYLLVREPGPPASLRLVEAKERPPSVLARFVPCCPFPPTATLGRITVPMGGDSFHAVAEGAASNYLLRTRCHARDQLDVEPLDLDGLDLLVRWQGQLLARFHWQGLGALGRSPTGAITDTYLGAKPLDAAAQARRAAGEAAAASDDLGGQARDLAAHLHEAHRAFRKLTG